MKIAQLIPQFYPHIGGAEICVHNISEKLAEIGYKTVVITTTSPPEKKIDLPYNIEYLWNKTGGLFRNLPVFLAARYLKSAIASLQKKYKFDIWQITNGYPFGAYSVDFFRKNRIPCLLRCCGEDIQTYPEIQYGVRLNHEIDRIVREKYPFFDGFVALTPSVKEEYLKLGIPDSKIRIIPNGVKISRFAEITENKRSNIRDELGVKPDETLIITVGRYHPKKGFDLIPEIALNLSMKNLKFKWLIAGRNACEIRKKSPDCEKYGLIFTEKFAKFANEDAFELPSSELIALYSSADIFALPTLIETFGMVLVEAMAAGLAIVTTNAPGVRDVVQDENQGLLADSGSIASFTEKTELVISDYALRKKLSLNSLECSKKYDWSIIVKNYENFYFELIKREKKSEKIFV